MKKIKKRKSCKRIKLRDDNIVRALKGEINLSTRATADEKLYSRKIKHKKDFEKD